MVENNTEIVALFILSSPKRQNKNDATTVANTSKKPSTQR